MLIKSIPRAHVDLNTPEALSVFFQLFNLKEATASDKVPQFEEEFAKYIGTKYAVAFPYCRTGMYFALKALGLEPNDEVILPAFTFWVDAAMVIMAGLKPVFVDVQFNSSNIDPEKIEEVITPRTRVIFPTHLNGLPADMSQIMQIAKKYNLRVLEDCARSCGATYKNKRIGSFDIGAFSFGYGKSFYDFGGAMVTSDDAGFIQRLKALKKDFEHIPVKDLYLQKIKGLILKFANMPYLYTFLLYPRVYDYYIMGNQRYVASYRVKMPSYGSPPQNFIVDLNNIQAKFGLKQIKRIDLTNKKRMDNARILTRELTGVADLILPPFNPDREHVAVHYAVWTEKFKDLQKFLILNKIDAQNESAVDTTAMERFRPYVNGNFAAAKKLDGKIIFLPTHPNLKKSDILYIGAKIKEFFNR